MRACPPALGQDLEALTAEQVLAAVEHRRSLSATSSSRTAATTWGQDKSGSKSCAKVERTKHHAARRRRPGSRKGLKPSGICCSVPQE
ncbi:MAG: hypothetical protein E5Y73_31480 [Mesorhizobium sp.]|nr:MAG: hypothetical protein E5Y83_25520 [Mesorhizobium sp.]TIL84803.1 MAG: hypothetical protein E5Y73_31480 [Mesorhizobium sp.]TIR28207.1 MAG: hypothetical protein E5X35_31695 [Mesorhizobium sp.]